MGALLIEHAQWSSLATDIEIAKRWATEEQLVLPMDNNVNYIQLTRDIALAVDPHTNQPTGAGEISVDGIPRFQKKSFT